MSSSGTYLRAVWPEDSAYRVDIEDDGVRVAYAYIARDGRIVGDVWLYNHGVTSDAPEWTAPAPRALLPFKNPSGLAKVEPFNPIADASEVTIAWFVDDRARVGADVSIRGRLHARVVAGETPGWCVLAIRDGPIARAFVSPAPRAGDET